jgi:hypothetical protein
MNRLLLHQELKKVSRERNNYFSTILSISSECTAHFARYRITLNYERQNAYCS